MSSYLSYYDMKNIKVTDGYFENALLKELDFLESLDVDRLLAGFRETAGLDMKGAVRYSGWENTLIGGHTLGHFLTACAQASVNPGVSAETRSLFTSKVTYIVDTLLECQHSDKVNLGFLSGSVILNPENVEEQFDNVEKGLTDITKQSWVPWYTMHKTLDGLINVYKLTGYVPAKEAAELLALWTVKRIEKWDEETRKQTLATEYGGMYGALCDVYDFTKNSTIYNALDNFAETELFELVASGCENALDNQHANTTIPKFHGSLKKFLCEDDKSLVKKNLEYAETFWQLVVSKHTYVTGGNSEWEHFGKDNILDAERTNCNCETCNTYNMLKLSRDLFTVTRDKKYADYYENTLFNAILSSQNSETGMSMYFQPMATGYFKTFSTRDTKFWCCTGTGMENFTKLNDSIYFKDKNAVIVNLYISSELSDTENGLFIKQTANMPFSDKVDFVISPVNAKSQNAKIYFRIPDWADSMEVLLNGCEINDDETASDIPGYVMINRTWLANDCISLVFGMKIKACSLPDNPDVFAFRYGPVVLSADLGFDGLVETETGVNVTIPEKSIIDSDTIVISKSSETVEHFIKHCNIHFERLYERENSINVALKRISFRLKDVDTPYIFSTHFSKNKERYGIYWNFTV